MRPDAVGPYKIERELGRGGMGEVYLALDTRLDRQVAIKSLPAHVATDPDRLARFQREAKVLASLNHPGIGAIYGIEEASGHQYLILELIEGETLADRMTRGAIPVEDALALAAQIAGAMEAAHDRGVVHRDLKPGNVMVTPDGVVKVLDFGLARTSDTAPPSTLMPASGPDSPTVAMPGPVHSPTIPGVIMGSAGYMSPEQARGKPVDKRSDIFSFGCVLYEMLTGDLPFQGETVADTIGATLHKELDFGRLPPETPPTIRLLLARCLTKNRADRLHDIGDARLEIAQAIRDPKGAMLGLGGQAGPSRASRGALPFVLAGAIAVVGGTFPLWSALVGLDGDATRTSAGKQVVRFTIEPPEGYTLPLYVAGGTGIAISPAGDRIVFIAEIDGKSHLCLRDVARAESRVLPNTERCGNPFFSPDGKWLGYVSKDRLMRMPTEGGPALAICDVTNYSSFAWLDDGTIVWGGGIWGIWRVRADGGTPERLAQAGPESKAPEGAGPVLGFDVPVSVPGADYILSGSWDGPTTESFNVMAVSLKDGSVRTVVRAAAEPRLIAPDLLAFMRGTTVMTVGFDPARGETIGEPTVALEGVRTDQWQDSAYIAGSRSGAFAYVPGGRFGSGKRLVGVDQSGKVTPLLDNTDNYNSAPAVSPDGRRIAITTLRTMVEVWVLDLERRSMSLVSSGGEHYEPTWSVDGASILALYVAPSGTSSIARWPASGSGEPFALPGTTDTGDFYLPRQELADGSGLLLQTVRSGASDKPDIAIYNYAKASFTPVRNRPAAEVDACISPDGNMIAYASDESGRLEVYVGPLNAPGPNIQVSTQGGAWPRFSGDGKRLFFVDPNEVMMAATIEARGAAPAVSLPTKLFDAKSLNLQSTSRSGFGVLPGDTFVMIEKAPWELQPPVIHVILNWAEELRTRSPASR